MASITLKNIPDDLRLQLKALARQHGRSMNQEIIQRLCATLSQSKDPRKEAAMLADLHRFREQLGRQGVWLTEEVLNHDKREGRL